MKKQAVFTLVACSIAALFLMGVLAAGLAGFEWNTPQEEMAGAEKKGPTYEYTWNPQETEVTGLSVEWVNGDVELKVGTGDLIRITESCGRTLNEKEKLKLSSSGGNLKIEWSDSFFLFNLFQNGEKNLTVEVPKTVSEALEELSCSTTSGTVNAVGFTAEKLNLSTASGDMELSALSGKTGRISTTSGTVECQGLSFAETLSANSTSGPLRFLESWAEEVDLSTVSGDISYIGKTERISGSSVSASIRAELNSCPEESNMESVSGRLTLVIPQNKGFEVEYDSISGGFSSDFPINGGGGSSGRALYAGGNASFHFSTTSGEMEVLKK